jgi:hypothetical protein
MGSDATTDTTTAPAATTPAGPSDTGLGFADFLNAAPAPEGDSPSPEPATTATTPSDATPKPAMPDKPETIEAKPATTEGKPDATEGKAETTEAKTDAPATPQWDSDANPWKSKATQFEARLTETRNYATRVDQQNRALAKKLDVLTAKIDGTYVEDSHETPMPSAEDIQRDAQIGGKVHASKAIAEEQFGAEFVHAQLFADNAPFRKYDNDPAVQARILGAPAPVIEALKFLKEEEFSAAYGRDPEAVKTKLRSELQTEIEAKVTERLRKEFEEQLKNPKRQITSLTGARGSAGTETREADANTTPATLRDLGIGNPGLA